MSRKKSIGDWKVVRGSQGYSMSDTGEINEDSFFLPHTVIPSLANWMVNQENDIFSMEDVTGDIKGDTITVYDDRGTTIPIKQDDIDAFLKLLDVEVRDSDETEPDIKTEQIIDNVLEADLEGLEEPERPEEKPIPAQFNTPVEAKTSDIQVETLKPAISKVYRVAYVQCPCGAALELGVEPSYDWRALSCPACEGILLLQDA